MKQSLKIPSHLKRVALHYLVKLCCSEFGLIIAAGPASIILWTEEMSSDSLISTMFSDVIYFRHRRKAVGMRQYILQLMNTNQNIRLFSGDTFYALIML